MTRPALDLDRQADAVLLAVRQAGVQRRVQEEQADAGVELLDHIVHIQLQRALVVFQGVDGAAGVELGLAVLAEQLDLADAEVLREQVAGEAEEAVALGVAAVEAAVAAEAV